jgi:hypothetical protein
MSNPAELIIAHQKRIDVLNGEGDVPSEIPADAHTYLRQVYQDPRHPVHIRMKAAIEAIAYERPKLAVTANIAGQDIATLLEERIHRITKRNQEGEPANGDDDR